VRPLLAVVAALALAACCCRGHVTRCRAGPRTASRPGRPGGGRPPVMPGGAGTAGWDTCVTAVAAVTVRSSTVVLPPCSVAGNALPITETGSKVPIRHSAADHWRSAGHLRHGKPMAVLG
jgi:hypothetical protein